MRYVFVRATGRGRKVYHLISADGNTPLCGRRLISFHWQVSDQARGKLCRYCRKVKYGDHETETRAHAAARTG